MDHADGAVLLIEPLDDGPVDVEHIQAVAAWQESGAPIDTLNSELAKLQRPARAIWYIGPTEPVHEEPQEA